MDEKEEKPKSRLSEDVIYGIAEQMFFKKPFSNKELDEIDLTMQNPYTIFMGHCQVHLNAMMAQFAKLKRIEFRGYDNQKDEIQFYKHKEGSFSNRDNDIKDAFSGPYRVTKPMAFGVIEYGKLRVSAVQTSNYLKKLEKTIPIDDDFHAAKKPIEVFAALFLDNDMSEEDIAKNCELNIEHLRVYEPADVIEVNLLSLLALNPLEIELVPRVAFLGNHSYSDSIFFGCPNQSIQNNTSFANKTSKSTVKAVFSLDSPIEDIATFGLKWQRQARFLANFCPNLDQLHFELSIYFTGAFILEQIMQQVRAILNAIRQLLEQMDGGGSNEKLRVCVEFTSTCAKLGSVEAFTALDNSAEDGQQLFKLGSPIDEPFFNRYSDDSSPYIARSIEIVDKAGRPHLCKFKVFEETHPPEIYEDYDYDYSYGYDLNPEYGPGGRYFGLPDSDSDYW